MKGHGVKEAGRDTALVAGAAGSEGLGYSRNTPYAGQLRRAGWAGSWDDRDTSEPGSLLTGSMHSHSTNAALKCGVQFKQLVPWSKFSGCSELQM